jgi:PAS domain S-box-containing protein
MKKKRTYEELETDLKKSEEAFQAIRHHEIDAILGEDEKISYVRLKDVEDQLCITQKKYENLVKYAPAGVYEIDFINRKFTIINDIICEYTGYTKEELLSMDPMDILTESSKKMFASRLDTALHGGQLSDQFEYEIKRKNGDTLWALINCHFVRKKDIVVAAFVVAHDITDRKKTEKDLFESRALLQTLLTEAPLGFAYLDRDLRFQVVNDSLAKINGNTVKAHIGKSIADILPNLYPVAKKIAATILETGKPVLNFEVNGMTPANRKRKRFWMENWYPIYNDNDAIMGFGVIVQDITKQKESVHLLRESEGKYRFLYENNQSFNVIVSPDATIQGVNKTVIQTLGYTKEEIIGTPIETFIIPKQRKTVTNLFKEMLKGKENPGMDVHFVGRDGRIHTIMFSQGNVKLESIRGSQFLFSGIDITDRREIELQLKTIFNTTPDIIARYDLQHRHLFVTPSIKRVTGLSPEQYLGKSNEELGMPDRLCRQWNAVLDKVAVTGKIEHTEFTFPGPKGDIEYNWLIVPELNNQGDVVSILGFARNITQLKKYQKQLEDIAKFPNQNPHPVMRINNKGIVLFSNTAGQAILRHWGSSIGKLVPPYMKNEITSVLKAGKIINKEVTLEKQTFFYSLVPFTENGYVNLYFLDITAVKQTENALAESEERLLLAQKAARIGNWEFNIETRMFSWSEIAKSMFPVLKGKKTQTLDSFVRHVHPDDRERATEMFHRSIKNKDHYYQWLRFVFQDGTVRWVEMSGNVFSDSQGKMNRLIGIIQDITKQKQWEEFQEKITVELQRERDILEIIKENTETNLAYLDYDFNFIDINTAYAKTCFLPKVRIIGKNYFDLFPSKENEEIFKQVRTTGKRVEYKEKQYELPRQKKQRYWNWSLNPIFNSSHTIQGFVLTVLDVTETVETEKKIFDLNNALIRRTMELAMSNQELEAFTYSASHDLQAPLRSISGFSEILLEDYSDKLDDNGKQYLRRICASSAMMSQLIQDLLKLSRISRTSITLEKTDLSKCAKEIIAEFKQQEPKRRIDIKIEQNLTVYADKNLMKIALNNLLGNAWKFSRNKEKTSITFGMTEKDGQNIYFIKDNGAGFDPKYADKLFVPFQRLHNEKDYPGTGIGLPLVARIIHRHNGEIWGEGKEGKGATFYFFIDTEHKDNQKKHAPSKNMKKNSK